MKSTISIIILAAISALAFAPADTDDPDSTDLGPHKPSTVFTYKATHLEKGSVKLDGILDESAWQQSETISGFTQRTPDTGKPSSEQTDVKILYDDDAIYIGATLRYSSADSIASTLFRRDGDGYSDWFFAGIDSYNDQRTAFVFALNPRGVQKDVLIYNDSREDISWNAVWQGKSVIENNVWTLEMRIPLSQLRYDESSEEMREGWGVNFSRYIADRDEESYWAPTPPDDAGIVSKFGRLTELNNLPKKNQLEIVPYLSSQLNRSPFSNGNPFLNEYESSLQAGADVTYGLTSNLTLSATLNPDFGQVEADPAEVNLTAFETFFSERRPFFLEGTEIFDFSTNSMLRLGDVPTIFYSRRIGRAPQGRIPSGAEFSNMPESTPIIGAVKLSGKTSGGWSLGFLNAVTTEQQAAYTNGSGETLSASVEPFTNYSVARFQRDFNDGNSVAGIIFNSVLRENSDPNLTRLLADNAFTAGMDGQHRWNNNKYMISGRFAASHVSGSSEVIRSLQLSSARYFQRPDADNLSLNEKKTSLSGMYGDVMITRQTRHWISQVRAYHVTPGFEVNDLGFQTIADRTTTTAMQIYQQPNSGLGWLRNFNTYLFSANTFNSGGDYVNNLHGVGGSFRFSNFWSLNTEVFASVRSVDDKLTRGGPVARRPASMSSAMILSSDNRKALRVRILARRQADELGGFSGTGSVRFQYRPHPAANISVEPTFSVRENKTQYVSSVATPEKTATFGNRYVFADLRQQTVSATVRMEWTFSPSLSFQMFAQPFISSGHFSGFKELDRPGSMDYEVYGEDTGNISFNPASNRYEVSPAGSSNAFQLPNPDFNIHSLLGNAVVRWEYRPGSTIFFVWSQARSGYRNSGSLDVGDTFSDLFSTPATHTFLVKFSYWLGS
ncbi:DUF5916 domain-containing protein [Rhodohalobacter mucosus]|uniref:DUF5916 domain-containing protein n=1 Tax=Rhodohalobacter mucosus TaxID=2079485 RepID=A0A316TNW4_9BACT|nr:DUF5916 domain-containing protein [Rhodohalobacter mucosus]PWN06297.1 hypothetical protein DDZ15_10765 [Rhodohalobacter mucosus]